MKWLDRLFDKNVICIGTMGAFAAAAAITSNLGGYPVISPLCSLTAASVLGYYGWSSLNTLLSNSIHYYKVIFDKGTDSEKVSIMQEFGNELTYSKATEFLVKSSIGANIFVNTVKTILCTNSGAAIAANTVTPLAIAATFGGLTFFSNRIDALRDYDQKMENAKIYIEDQRNLPYVEVSAQLIHTETTEFSSHQGESSLLDIAGMYDHPSQP